MIPYFIEYCAHYDAEILSVHYTWKVGEKRFKMSFMMNTLVMINSCEITIEKNKKNFFAKNHCKIQVHTILVYALNSLK